MRPNAWPVLGATLLVAAILTRMVVSVEPFPGWGDDPTIVPAVATSIGPTVSLVLDAAIALAAGVLVLGVGPRSRTHAWLGALVALGAGGACVLSVLPKGRTIDDALLASAWSAAWFGALGCFVAARDANARRILVGGLLSGVAMLACKGAAQYFADHATALEEFNRSKRAFLDAKGWTEDSPNFRAFVRRLSQRDATGWFGLSNVYASVAAGCFVAFVSIVVGAWRGARVAAWSAILGMVLAGGALAMSESKGGVMAAGVGLVVLALAWVATDPLARLRGRFASVLGLAAVLGPLAMVALRGALGERLGELSILFRWFYVVGASRIFADHPLAGVGPAGFQHAYALAKPPISPENVSSPHSVLFDYVSTLGIAGVPWAAALILLAVLIGPRAWRRTSKDIPTVTGASLSTRATLRALFAAAATATLVGAFVEAEMATPLVVGVRAAGLLLFMLVAWGVLELSSRAPFALMLGVASAALALVAHGQIELTPVNLGSCAWFMGVCALAAGWSNATDEPSSVGRASRPSFLPALPALTLALAIAWYASARSHPWERELRAGANAVRPLAEVSVLMRSLRTPGLQPKDAQAIAKEAAAVLSDATGRRVPLDPRAMEDASVALRHASMDVALAALRRALATQPDHANTARAASLLMYQHAANLASSGKLDEARALIAESAEVCRRALAQGATESTLQNWLGTLLTGQLDTSGPLAPGESERKALLDGAASAFGRAAELDTYSPANHLKHAEALTRAGRPKEAAQAARRALDADALARLDPTQQLTPEQRAGLERIASEGP